MAKVALQDEGVGFEPLHCGAAVEGAAWFCLQTRPKQEHIAAGNLRRLSGLEAFAPRIVLRKVTPRGVVRFPEGLFPGYIFARFEISRDLGRVMTTTGVKTVVRFGSFWPMIPAGFVLGLREEFPEVLESAESACYPEAGEMVRVAHPVFDGVEAKVMASLPSVGRVRVLLELLGRMQVVEVGVELVAGMEPRGRFG